MPVGPAWLFLAVLAVTIMVWVRPAHSAITPPSMWTPTPPPVETSRTTTSVPPVEETTNQATTTASYSVTGCPTEVLGESSSGERVQVFWVPPELSGDSWLTTRSSTHDPGDFFPVGETEVVYTFNSFGEQQRCIFTVNVVLVDDIPPVVICPDNIMVTAPSGSVGLEVTWPEPSVTDNVGNVTLRQNNYSPGDLLPNGVNTVTYEYEDSAGNSATCSFTVTVVVPIIVTNCPVEGYSHTINYISLTFNVSLGFFQLQVEGPYTRVIRVPDEGHFFSIGVTPITYTFIDVNNEANTATCTFNLTLIPMCPSERDIICSTPDYGCIPATLPDCEPDGTEVCRGCGEAELVSDCLVSSGWFIAITADDRKLGRSAVVFEFQPPDSTDEEPVYLTRLRIAWAELDELNSPEALGSSRGVAVFVNVSVAGSTPTNDEVEFWVFPGLSASPTVVTLQVPLHVQTGDIVTMTLRYKDYVSAQRDPCSPGLPVQTACQDCVSVQYGVRTVDCRGSLCHDTLAEWRAGLLGENGPSSASAISESSYGEPTCLNEENVAALMNIFNYCLLIPINVTNCPVEGYSLGIPFIRSTPSADFWFPRPWAEGPVTRVIRVPDERHYFDVGVTAVSYTFTDVNDESNTATCEFNVTLIPECPNADDIICSSPYPVCIPASVPVCESDGRENVCKGCAEAEELVMIECLVSRWLGATTVDYREGGTAVAFEFLPPGSTDEKPVYLIAVEVAWAELDELNSPEALGSSRGVVVFVNVSVAGSTLTTDEVEFWVFPGLTASPTALTLQLPLRVQTGDVVTVTLGYKDYISAQRDPCSPALPIQTACQDCVSVQYGVSTVDCRGSRCHDALAEWRAGLSGEGGLSPVDQSSYGEFVCRNDKNVSALMRIFSYCWQCPSADDISCSSPYPVCIPASLPVCESDGRDYVCKGCVEAELVSNCLVSSGWFDAITADFREGSTAVIFNFQSPDSTDEEPVHLTAVVWAEFDELNSPEALGSSRGVVVFVNVSVAGSTPTTDEVEFWVFPGLSASPTVLTLQVPLRVQTGDIVTMTLRYKDYVSAQRDPCSPGLPVQTACQDCVSVQYGVRTVDCRGSLCHDTLAEWRAGLLGEDRPPSASFISESSYGEPTCRNEENVAALMNIFNYCLLTPIIVTNCPAEGYSLRIPFIRSTPSTGLGFPPPRAEGPVTRVIRVPDERHYFDVGVTAVTYTFSDVNDETNTATCKFNVTLIPECPSKDDIICSSPSPVCIPASLPVCESDGREYMCKGCWEAELVVDCLFSRRWFNATTAGYREGSTAVTFGFQPPDSTDEEPVYLTALRIAWAELDELNSPEALSSSRGVVVFVNVSVAGSTPTTDEVEFWVFPGLSSSPIYPGLKVPLRVQTGDIVTMTLRYKDYESAWRDPCSPTLPVQTACLDCVSALFSIRSVDCRGSLFCHDAYLKWRKPPALSREEDQSSYSSDYQSIYGEPMCRNKENDAALMRIYSYCLPKAEFVFVSPNQSSVVGDVVVLRCVGTGLTEPVVEWLDESKEVVASGIGTAVLEVTVERYPRSFTCILDGSTDLRVVHETVTTVSETTGECTDLSERLDSFSLASNCFSLSQATGYMWGDNFFSFGGWRSDALVYQIRIASNALYGVTTNMYAQEPRTKFVSSRLEIEHGVVPRRRRGASGEYSHLYRKEYDPVYISYDSMENVTFDLDPPLPANTSLDWTVRFFNANQTYDRRRSERRYNWQPQLLLLNCTNNTSPMCRDDADLVRDWSSTLQQYTDAGCNSERSSRSLLLLKTFKVCRGIAIAPLRIRQSPLPLDASLQPMPGTLGFVFDCYIENAVKYHWYKTAPGPGEIYVRSGNQLIFPYVDFRLQGAYVCEGVGGRPFENVRLRTEPATYTIRDAVTFKVTMKLDNQNFTEDLRDQQSERFRSLAGEILMAVYPLLQDVTAGLLGTFSDAEVIAFYPGSILAEFLVFFGRNPRPVGRLERLPVECGGPLCPPLAEPRDSVLQDRLMSAIRENLDFFSGLAVDPNNIEIVNLVSCPEEVVPDGNLTFPQTRIGRTAYSLNLCPKFTSRTGQPLASRACVGDFVAAPHWEDPVLLNCFEGDINEILDDLANVSVTPENAEDIAREVEVVTANSTAIGPSGITSVAGILERLVAANRTSVEVASSFVGIVNNILQIDDPSTFEEAANDNSPSRIILALEAFVRALQTTGAGNFTEVQSSVAVQAISVPRRSLENGLGFASRRTSLGIDELTENQISLLSAPDPPFETDASIYLPAAILNMIPEVSIANDPMIQAPLPSIMGRSSVSAGDGDDMVPISFFIYQNSRLFRSPKLEAAGMPENKFRRNVGSRIIAATVENVWIENLESPVVSEFNFLNVSNKNETVGGAECVFWDFTLNDGFGDWSSEGCRNESVSEDTVRCLCDHLTSFAVIVDIYGQTTASVALDVISKLGCAVSIIALLITIVTYLYSKKLRTKRPQQILLSLCFALLGLYFFFLVGIEATASRGGCIFVAVLIHYFTLAAIAWMAIEAANMYLLFVRVLNANVAHFMLKASIAGWGLPLLIVVIILAVDYTEYENPNYCFLKPGNAINFGQLLPIGLVLLFNFIVFTLVTQRLTCARKTVGSTSDKSQRQERIRRLQNAIAISVLLGLTWVFGLLSLIWTATFAFQVLFAVFNSLQGLAIFVLFCARQQEVRQVWREMFRCRRTGRYALGATSRTGAVESSGAPSGIPMSSQGTKVTNASEAVESQK